MLPNPVEHYIAALRQTYKGGDATERSYYPALKQFVHSFGPKVDAVCEPKRSESGAVDFSVKNSDMPVGHIEAKDVGASLDAAEHSEQVKRYRAALPNFILTNFLEFRWYVNGEHRKTIRLGEVADHRKLKTTKDGRAELSDLLKSFLVQEPRGADNAKDLAVRLARLAHEIRNVIAQGFGLNHVSANLVDLRNAVKKELIPDLTDDRFADLFAQTLAYGLFAAWVHHPDAKPFERAGAASDIPKTNPFLRRLFEMTTGTELEDEPFAGYVDYIVQLLGCTEKAAILQDFGRRTGRADPVVHFYETFLKEFDPEIREMRGVYYTPEPVVSYMVRSVDHLLKTRFGLPKGLADTAQAEYEVEGDDGKKVTKTGPRVLILDPACGTGTFLFEIVNHIRDEFIRGGKAGAWKGKTGYVAQHLLPRLFGFELLMAPYAMAHLRLGLQLAGQDLDEPARSSYAYDFAGDERLGVYLTNSVERAFFRDQPLLGPYRAITEEANAAVQVKQSKPIMVVIGNPPYSGHSANRSFEMVEITTEKARRGRRAKRRQKVATFIGELLHDYYRADGAPLGERNPKWLQDDYVKFIRFGQWRIERTGGGILALITNHSYLDNPTFRGMRQQLMEAFTDIYVLDLHGNKRKKEVCPDGSRDKNVFEIQQGVAIAIFVKDPDADGPARVWHADLWGLREAKEAYLAERSCATIQWQELRPQSPAYLFVPQASELDSEYEAYPKVTDMMPLHGVGMTTARDRMVIDFDAESLVERARVFRDSRDSDAALCERLGISRKKGWNISKARADLQQEDSLLGFVESVTYRPFDNRLIFYHGSLVWRTVERIMRHMRRGENRALLFTRPMSPQYDFSALVSSRIIDQCAVGNKSAGAGISYLAPLYRFPPSSVATWSRAQPLHEERQRLDGAGGGAAAQERLVATMHHLFADREYPRWPNLDPLLLADLEERLGLKFIPDGTGDLEETFGPEDVFNYIYAVLHSPTYRERYAEFLKRDFPRIPFTSDRKLFAKLAEKGAELVAYHLLESDALAGIGSALIGEGDNTVERVRYDANDKRVYINKTQYFADVPSEVWGFKVGGYQVCEKWLKDRKGRELKYDDQEHYSKVVVALRHTRRLMTEIDALIPSWPLE